MNVCKARTALLVLVGVALGASYCRADAPTFEKDVKPLVAKYCLACHNADKTKGKLDLSRFETDASVIEAAGIWQRAAKRVLSHEMPPMGADKPSEVERKLIVDWSNALENKNSDCDQIASEESTSWYPGYVISRRLSRSEYQNTIRDLFGMDIPVAEIFPADGAGGEGFDNSGNALFISEIQAEKYLKAASLAVETALPKTGRGKRDDAERDIAAFLERAWRRPATPEDMTRIMGLFDHARGERRDYQEALKLAYKAVLVSPHFLFLAEPHPDKAGVYELGDYQLATRLSYFLWASMPDAELFAAAKAGGLHDPEQIRAQVTRMLLDPKARALGEVFAEQWLGVTQLGETLKPDPDRFKEFDTKLRNAMLDEVAEYFHRIVAENRSVLELIQSDYTYANERLAAVYGINGVHGNDMQLVSLSDPNRGGVTGMAAVLTATSHPLRTSPVLRGKWVLEQLLGDNVPPPPPNVPKLPEDDKQADGLSFRARLELHRSNPDCAGCHARMDPIGFGLENFDPIGRWRTEAAGQPIDSKGTLPSGESFGGPQELKTILMKHKDEFARNLSRKMLGYALGRPVGRMDTCVVDRCMKNLQANDYRASEIILTIALSQPFRHRYSPGASEGGA